jgi:hypothetical protein
MKEFQFDKVMSIVENKQSPSNGCLMKKIISFSDVQISHSRAYQQPLYLS